MYNKQLGRRAFLSLAGLTAAGLALSSCKIRQSGTRIIKNAFGDNIVVPAGPERVAAMSEPTLDNALALGATLIGGTAGRGQSTIPNYLEDKGHGVPILGNVAQPSYGALKEAKPDLILIDGTSIGTDQQILESLTAIAPLAYTGYAGGDWRDNLRITADALNMTDEADDLVSDYNDKIKSAQRKLEKYRNKTFSIIRWQGDNASLILKELPAGRALTDLGLNRPPNQDRDGEGHSEPVPRENLADIDADYIFLGTLGGADEMGNGGSAGTVDVERAKKAVVEAARVPGFTGLRAYQEDHIIPVDGSLWTSAGGVLLMNTIVDQIVELLV